MDGLGGASRPRGDITTLLDLATRDNQDDYYTPINSETTWFTRDQERRNRPFVPAVQNFPFRGPAAFGQRFTFDVGSVSCGDLLFNVMLQIKLGHWFDQTTILRILSGRYQYKNPEEAWYYANSLGTAIVEKAELEIEDQLIETIDGDFAFITGKLFTDLNQQVGLNTDGIGYTSFEGLKTWSQSRPFPTEGGNLLVNLPFFFSRTHLKEAMPLIACREGTVRIHITLRKFEDCVRIQSGLRASCTDTPLGKTFSFIDTGLIYKPTIQIQAETQPPQFLDIQLITYGAYITGTVRERMLRTPFEILHRGVETFVFSEPLKYLMNKGSGDTITIQLPLEANHPMEEILWVMRRKAATINNNEWSNYTNVTSFEYDPTFNPTKPFLLNASIQINGIELINSTEDYFRQLIARHHRGGAIAFASYIYGYPFARSPSEHQPSGTLNASRTQNVRLNLTVRPPGGALNQEWEVAVYVVGLRWLRFENGIANKMFDN
jgi:Large eukaryotic DNA virus major capsid protein/Major capsid protein N-terminus